MAGLLRTNRQSWPCISGLCVVCLNLPWTFLNWQLLYNLLPEVRLLLSRAWQVPAPTEVAVLAKAAFDKAQIASWIILVVNVCIMLLFPLLALERILLRDVHNKAFVPSEQLGKSVGYATLPQLASLPLGVTLNPILELVELGIGWSMCAQSLMTSALDEDLCALLSKGTANTSYVSHMDMGRSFRRLAEKTD